MPAKDKIEVVRKWVGPISTTVMLAIVGYAWQAGGIVFQGGVLARTVEADSARIAKVEVRQDTQELALGAVNLSIKGHEKEDDQRVKEHERRINEIEQTIKIVSDIRGELRAINVKLEGINQRLDREGAK